MSSTATAYDDHRYPSASRPHTDGEGEEGEGGGVGLVGRSERGVGGRRLIREEEWWWWWWWW